MAATALEIGARFDDQERMDNVADDLGGGAKLDLFGLDLAADRSMDTDRFGLDLAVDRRAFAYGQGPASHIAIDDAVDLDVAVTDQVADDPERGTDDRRHLLLLICLNRRDLHVFAIL